MVGAETYRRWQRMGKWQRVHLLLAAALVVIFVVGGQSAPRIELPPLQTRPPQTSVASALLPANYQMKESAPFPTYFIVSARRSGTHLAIGMLPNCFRNHMSIIKTNHVQASVELGCDCINWMKAKGGIIHAHREIEEYLISMYFYRKVGTIQDLKKC